MFTKKILWISIILILLSIIAAGCSGGTSATSVTKPQLLESKSFTHQNLFFSISYPPSWMMEEDDEGVFIGKGDETLSFMVVVEKSGSKDVDLTKMSTDFINGFGKSSGMADLEVSSKQNINFASEKWYETNFSLLETSSKTKYSFQLRTANRKNLAYFVLYMAPADTFEKAKNNYFIAMMDTFKFTN